MVRAIFKSFDQFMTVYVSVMAVALSSAFMPVVGGPLRPYEMRALGDVSAGVLRGQTGRALDILQASLDTKVGPLSVDAAGSFVPEVDVALSLPTPELLGGPPLRDVRVVTVSAQLTCADREQCAIDEAEAPPA